MKGVESSLFNLYHKLVTLMTVKVLCISEGVMIPEFFPSPS